mgnify:CR=1 FL=1
MFRGFLLSLLVCATLPAQSYVRPFSAGVTARFFPIGIIEGAERTQIFSPQIENRATGENKSNFYGFGVKFQAALPWRLAVVSGLTMNQIKFKHTVVGLIGTPNPNSAIETRRGYTTTENTRARYYDLPVLVRRFSKPHKEDGVRWFYEAGGTLRKVSNIRTSLEIDDNSRVTCCDESPARPSRELLPGLTAGGGLYAKDDFGIRVVPEIRYTWWLGRTFSYLAAGSRRHQLELLISLTF